MSDLERQASTWVPPWQRPTPEPPAENLTQADEMDLAAAVAARLARSLAPTAAVEADDEPQDDGTETVAEARVPAARRPSDVDSIEDADDDVEPAESVVAKPAETIEAQASETAVVQAPVPAEANGAKKPEKAERPRKKAKAGPEANEGEGAEAKAALAVEPLRPLADEEVVPVLEAILMVVDEPVSEITLAQVLDLDAEQVAGVLIELSARYSAEGRGFDLRRAAGGWRFYTRTEYASYVERFVLDGQQLRLTQASLETLAVVAYKQPVTRSRVSAIRGVNCDGVIRTLVTRGMIEECGIEQESGAHLYRTTTLFLEKMGLDSVEQLPPLAPFLPDNLEELAGTES